MYILGGDLHVDIKVENLILFMSLCNLYHCGVVYVSTLFCLICPWYVDLVNQKCLSAFRGQEEEIL